MKKFIAYIVLFLSVLFSTPPAFAQHRQVIVFSGSTSLGNGKAAMERGELEKAINYYNSALRVGLSPLEYYTAYNDLCVAYYLNEEFSTALKSCNRAIKTISNKWIAYNNRGNIHLAAGRYLLAIDDYKKGLEMKKSSEVLKTNLEIAKNRQAHISQDSLETTGPNKNNHNIKNKGFSVFTMGSK